ncbi:hypothetical protein AAF712_008452 [Marasmius tenuissimus]|uniref:Uncharacterized protein n=1 Tax=Marasmius tenuissimus TaxID=585030 RepID=A0ABR2ZSH9_9AGAR
MITHLRRHSEELYTIHEISHASDDIYNFIKRELLPHRWPADFSKGEGLTRSKWIRNKATFERIFHKTIQSRRRREREYLVLRVICDARDRLIVGQSNARHWPSGEIIACGMSPFRELRRIDLFTDYDSDTIRLACEEGMAAQFPTVVDEWLADVEEHLKEEIGGGSLDLATSIFRCRASSICGQGTRHVGLEAVTDHLRGYSTRWDSPCPLGKHCLRIPPKEMSQIRFCRTASSVVLGLLDMLGLGASRTLAEDMDSRGDRFRCLSCNATPGAGYDWRKAVGFVYPFFIWNSPDHHPGCSPRVKPLSTSKSLGSYVISTSSQTTEKINDSRGEPDPHEERSTRESG